ncbi:hypothetical protein ACFQX6_66240 [Streptosporangium lutulentum]
MKLKTAEDELSPLAQRAVDLAGDRGVRMVPVVPIARQGAEVYLEPEDMDLEELLDLVVAAGQKLAYIEPSPFDIADVVELAEDDLLGEELDPALRAQITKLRKSAARFNGWPISLEVAFMYQGVVHRWVADAPWYEQLRTEVAAVVPAEDEDDPEPQLPEAERAAIVERLTQELLARAEFRAAAPRAIVGGWRGFISPPRVRSGPLRRTPHLPHLRCDPAGDGPGDDRRTAPLCQRRTAHPRAGTADRRRLHLSRRAHRRGPQTPAPRPSHRPSRRLPAAHPCP